WDVSQPTCVPVSRRFSRRNCTSRVRASTSPLTGLPLTVMDTAGMSTSRVRAPKALFSPDPLRGGGLRPRNRAVSDPDALGTGPTLNPGNIGGQGTQGREDAERAPDGLRSR